MNSFHNYLLIVGTRTSRLAQAQVQEVLQEIRAFHPYLDFFPLLVQTTGDNDLKTSLRDLGKTNFFTKEIDELLLTEKCHIAIHSAKDLPDPLPEGLCVVALTRGVNPSDVLVLRENDSLEGLSLGASIGTSSLRREENIKKLRKDLVCVDIRGTIEQRLEKLDRKEVDGLVMAEAALIRLELTLRNRLFLPGPAASRQGQLVILARTQDQEMKELFSPIDVRAHENNTVSRDGSFVFSR